jgi:hypothetical protein
MTCLVVQSTERAFDRFGITSGTSKRINVITSKAVYSLSAMDLLRELSIRFGITSGTSKRINVIVNKPE